jgi:hypothetical protein
MLSRVVGLSAMPPSENARIEQLTQLIEVHGNERVEDALKAAAQKWKVTKNKNGKPYPITNMAWVDWAQSELDAGTSGSSVVTWAALEKMSESERQAYFDAGGAIPYE